MTDINTVFENQTGISGAKDFEQSKEKELGIFDVPVAYQEYDEIQSEIDNDEHSLSEVTTFAKQFNDAQVVRRDDIVALESLVGELESLPHLNSYTQEYSLVNYQITQENIFVTVTRMAGKIVKKIWEFIVNTLDSARRFIMELFNKNHYATDKASQEKIIKEVAKVAVKVESSQAVVQSKVQKMDDAQVKARIVRINKDLRALLYPKFKEIGVLSRGGDIDANMLIDEICEQRLKPFYTSFLKGVYEKDDNLKNLITLYLRSVTTEIELLSNRTKEIFEADLTQPPASPYVRVFTTVPEQVLDYIKTFGQLSVDPARIFNIDDQYKVMSGEAYQIAKASASISNTFDLPEPRTLLKLDLNWLGELFDNPAGATSNELKLKFETAKKSYRKIQVNFDNIDPQAKDAVNGVYADWITINKMILTLAVLQARISAIMSNVDSMTRLIDKVLNIINS